MNDSAESARYFGIALSAIAIFAPYLPLCIMGIGYTLVLFITPCVLGLACLICSIRRKERSVAIMALCIEGYVWLMNLSIVRNGLYIYPSLWNAMLWTYCITAGLLFICSGWIVIKKCLRGRHTKDT